MVHVISYFFQMFSSKNSNKKFKQTNEQLTKDLKLTLVHMWATPTIPDRRLGVNDDYYAWVIGGCPNQDVNIVRNGDSSRIELSTPTFKFKEFEDVYFHAQVKACKNNDCVSFFSFFFTWPLELYFYL